MPLIVGINGKRRPTYALLDTGANTSCITEFLCSELNAPREYISVNLNTFDQTSKSQRAVTSFTVTNLNKTFELSVENALIGNLLSTEGERPPTRKDLRQFDHLKDLRISELEDKSINILLDAKFAYFFCTGDIRKGREDQPIAWGTLFGHAIIGPEIVDKQNHNDEILAISTETVNISDHTKQAFQQDFLCRNLKSFPQIVHKSVGLKILDWKTNFPDLEISSCITIFICSHFHMFICHHFLYDYSSHMSYSYLSKYHCYLLV